MSVDADNMSEAEIWKVLTVARQAVDVEGYFIDAPEDGIVWYTNPYGVDGAIEGNEAAVSSFIRSLRKGRNYGSSPFEHI